MWEKYSHIVPLILVDSGVVNKVADWVLASGYKKPLVVCDPNTRIVAGAHVIESLCAAGLTVKECCFIESEPLPDEYSIGFLTSMYTPDTDLILGVGSGTINDICTFVGEKVGCPSAIVGTAPSMDGYSSLGSAMLLDGIKVTPPTQCPVAIFCDIDILSEAPAILSAAGLGDMLGKFTALADWRLANLLVGEPMPDDIVAIVKDALDKIVAGAPHLPKREPEAIKSVTEGLILSGIAMSLYGDSRPASGTEHHLAHFWEMVLITEGKRPALHGVKVGVATIVGFFLWKELESFLLSNDLSEATSGSADAATHAENIRRLYGRTADSILQTKNPNLPVKLIEANKKEILEIAASLPAPESISAMLAAAGAPICPSKINLGAGNLRDSIIYARDRKKTYTILQLLGDLGCLEGFAEETNRYFAKNALAGIKCFVLDMDGTIYLGDKIFSYTKNFLNHLKLSGMDHVFYTNNSSQNAAHYISKLQRMGLEVDDDKLFMSTQVLLAYLKNESNCPYGRRVFVSGTKALRDDFANAGYVLADDDPDFVVLGFDTDMDYRRLTKLCDFVRDGLPYFGVHMDYNCPVEGGFIPDNGSLAAAVTAATGVTPEFFGKPSRFTLDFLIQETGYHEEELCFIGDRLYTDIAITSGTNSRSVLVLSGETKLSDLNDSVFVPDLVVNDLDELLNFIV